MGLYDTIAASMPKVTGLRCTVCYAVLLPGSGRTIVRYLESGWPKCCGYTMHMHTEADPLPEKPITAEPPHG